jgi:fluoride exporter
MMLRNILLVGVGGAIGSIARYLSQKYIYEWHPHPFPFGTLLVNILGSFLIGIVYAMAEKGNMLTAESRLFLASGLCGGFTTFSAFALENVILLKTGNFAYFAIYTAASVTLGILAVFGGIALLK